MPPTLRTARLLLAPVEDQDVAALQAHWSDPRVARFLWDANPVPTSTVATLVARSRHTFETVGWGLWALRPLAAPVTDAPLIGVCGLCPFEPEPGVELLYSLAPTHWSQGLATEAATAVVSYAFDTLELPQLVATTDDANKASLRLLTRLGATPTTRVQVGPHTYPCFTIHPPRRPGYARQKPL
jgi:[ribosomal protein S5]-alanine N-acetyltransferase